jgi:hypothetical protein
VKIGGKFTFPDAEIKLSERINVVHVRRIVIVVFSVCYVVKVVAKLHQTTPLP